MTGHFIKPTETWIWEFIITKSPWSKNIDSFFHDSNGQEGMTLKLWLLRLLSFFHWLLFTLVQIFELNNNFFLIRVDQYIIYIVWLFLQRLPFLWWWLVQFTCNFHHAFVTAIYNNSAALYLLCPSHTWLQPVQQTSCACWSSLLICRANIKFKWLHHSFIGCLSRQCLITSNNCILKWTHFSILHIMTRIAIVWLACCFPKYLICFS